MILALEEVVKHIENNYGDIIVLSEVDKSCEDRITAKATIEVRQGREDSSGELHEGKVVDLEITQSGFRVLGSEESGSHETIEGLLLSLAPETWIRYFETKIEKRLQG